MRSKLGIVCAGLMMTSTALGGPLTPPGAPGSTYKTLVDVEPRAALYDTGTGIVINQAGSYYLAENVSAPAGGTAPAVWIQTSDVTLDLNGFSLVGSTGGVVQAGIRISSNRTTVVNGTISDYSWGIRQDSGTHATVRDVRIKGTTANEGILLGNNATVSDCSVDGAVAEGIEVGAYAMIQRCTVTASGSIGVSAGASAKIRGNIVTASGVGGIWAGDQAMVVQCSVKDTGSVGISTGAGSMIDGCTVTGSANSGIQVSASTVRATAVTDSQHHGMYIFSDSVVDGCSVQNSNLGNGGYYGIIGSSNNRISDTTVTGTQFATGSGIAVNQKNKIVGCLVESTGGVGIFLIQDNVVRDTEVAASGDYSVRTFGDSNIIKGSTFSNHGSDKAHLRIETNNNVIDGNAMVDGTAFSVTGISNRIFRNVMNGTQGALNTASNDVAAVTTANAATGYYNNIN